MTRRWRAWRGRRRAARASAWAGLDDLTLTSPEVQRVRAMRKAGRTPAGAAERIRDGRVRRRTSRPGVASLDATLGGIRRR